MSTCRCTDERASASTHEPKSHQSYRNLLFCDGSAAAGGEVESGLCLSWISNRFLLSSLVVFLVQVNHFMRIKYSRDTQNWEIKSLSFDRKFSSWPEKLSHSIFFFPHSLSLWCLIQTTSTLVASSSSNRLFVAAVCLSWNRSIFMMFVQASGQIGEKKPSNKN